MKSSSIKGFTRFTGTDEQRIEATPKRRVGRSNRLRGARIKHQFFGFSVRNQRIGAFLRHWQKGHHLNAEPDVD